MTDEAYETSITDHIESIREMLITGEYSMIIRHPNPAVGSSSIPEDICAAVGAALSGTREAVEPVAWCVVGRDGKVVGNEISFHKEDIAWAKGEEGFCILALVPADAIAAAPPSDPVGQGAVTGESPLRKAARQVESWWLSDGMKHFNGAPYAIFALRSALSPAPEAGSDEAAVDRFATAMKAKLKWEREERGRHGWNDPAICSAEYLAGLLIEHLRKGNDGNFEDIANFCMMLHQRGDHPRVVAEAAEARETALRDQLGKTRADAIEAVNQVVAERQADLHGKRSDFNKGAVDGLQHGLARLRRALSDAAEGGQ